MQIQLRHFRCLVTVAQERNLARAADKLSLTQPAVSKTLAELEAITGARLVDRGRRGATLTSAGEELLSHALLVLDAVAKAQDALTPSAQKLAPRLRVGALPSVAPALLPGGLDAFHKHAPDAQISVRTDENARLLADLRTGDLDLVVGRMADPHLMVGLAFELMYVEPLVLLVRGGHPLLKKQNVSMQDVVEYRVAVYGEGTIPRHNTTRLLQSFGMNLPAARLETLEVSVARLLTLQSDAVWFTPIGAALDELLSGRLRRLEIPTSGVDEPVGLVLKSDVPVSQTVRDFASVIREEAVRIKALFDSLLKN